MWCVCDEPTDGVTNANRKVEIFHSVRSKRKKSFCQVFLIETKHEPLQLFNNEVNLKRSAFLQTNNKIIKITNFCFHAEYDCTLINWQLYNVMMAWIYYIFFFCFFFYSNVSFYYAHRQPFGRSFAFSFLFRFSAFCMRMYH